MENSETKTPVEEGAAVPKKRPYGPGHRMPPQEAEFKRREDARLAELATLTPEERELRLKIEALNKRVREVFGARFAPLSHEATHADVDMLEERLVAETVSARVDGNHPDRQGQIAREVSREILRAKAPNFIQKLFRTAAARRQEAEAALGAAKHEEAKAVERFHELREVKAALAVAERNLARCRDQHAKIVALYEQSDATEAVVERYLLVADTQNPRSGDYSVIEHGRMVMATCIEDWPRIEATLQKRVTDLETKAAALEDPAAAA